jgi:hypothetical protein
MTQLQEQRSPTHTRPASGLGQRPARDNTWARAGVSQGQRNAGPPRDGAWPIGLSQAIQAPPQQHLSTRLSASFQMVYELEHRHELFGQPGKLAVLGFVSRGPMGRFDDAIAFAEQNRTTPSTADMRR